MRLKLAKNTETFKKTQQDNFYQTTKKVETTSTPCFKKPEKMLLYHSSLVWVAVANASHKNVRSNERTFEAGYGIIVRNIQAEAKRFFLIRKPCVSKFSSCNTRRTLSLLEISKTY